MIYIFFAYRDKYKYLHVVDVDTLENDIMQYTNNYKIINYNIGIGGFPLITINKKTYIILDCNKDILLLRNNIYHVPSTEEKAKILELYKNCNLDCL